MAKISIKVKHNLRNEKKKKFKDIQYTLKTNVQIKMQQPL